MARRRQGRRQLYRIYQRRAARPVRRALHPQGRGRQRLKRRPGPIARWRARRPEERRALIEALATLGWASALVKFAPFRRITALAERAPDRPPPADPAHTIAVVAWAVRAAARRAHFRAVCIEQGVAAQRMLRRRGIASTMYYGMARDPDRGLIAHVWLKVGDVDVVGGEVAGDFTLVARFPDADKDVTTAR